MHSSNVQRLSPIKDRIQPFSSSHNLTKLLQVTRGSTAGFSKSCLATRCYCCSLAGGDYQMLVFAVGKHFAGMLDTDMLAML